MNMNNSELSPDQQYAYAKFTEGHNLFITGPGGTGKTKLIHHLIKHAQTTGKKYQVCALTGCAALLLNCGARTLHSWSGIKLARGSPDTVVENVIKNRTLVRQWKKTNILIIDEVSMLSQKIFEIIEKIARTARNRPTVPFGGIQVIFTGDFFQLPPVGNLQEPATMNMCFESPIWNSVFPIENHIELRTMFRQTDPLYIDILLQIRKGELTDENAKILEGYIKRPYNPEDHGGCIPSKLFAVRSKADFVNNAMFSKIQNEEYTVSVKQLTNCKLYLDTLKAIPPEILTKCDQLSHTDIEREIDFLKTGLNAEENFVYKKGAVVICTINLSIELGICNGSLGIITDVVMKEGLAIPIVQFSNRITQIMDMHYWQSEDFPSIAIGQIPLKLAWALTIHKIQGATMEMAEMDIGMSIFEYGQIYVALSRIKSLDGLYLLNFQPKKIKANPKVIAFYKTLPVYDYPNKLLQSTYTPIIPNKNQTNMFAEFAYTNELENEEYVDPTSKKIAISNTTATYKVKKMNTTAPAPAVAPAVATFTVQKASESSTDDQLCCICIDSKKCVLLIPCKHVCMCSTCGLREDITDCPLCLTKIDSKMQIFV
jgi:ATP-dependent DNA helicase PIF1